MLPLALHARCIICAPLDARLSLLSGVSSTQAARNAPPSTLSLLRATCSCDMSPEIECDVAAAEAKPLETPDTFAQAAKLQRKAFMREKHARELADLKVRLELRSQHSSQRTITPMLQHASS